MKETECMRCDTPITVIALADGLHITWAEYYADSLIPWAELGVTAVTFKHPKNHGVESVVPGHTCGVCNQPISSYVYHCYRCNKACCDQHSSFVEDMQGSDHTGNFHTCCDDCLKDNAPPVDDAPTMREELTLDYAAQVAASDEPEPVTIESTIACMDYATAHQMWDNANRMFFTGQMEQKHYELICAQAKARMAELEARK